MLFYISDEFDWLGLVRCFIFMMSVTSRVEHVVLYF
jgi:hypothetical protein